MKNISTDTCWSLIVHESADLDGAWKNNDFQCAERTIVEYIRGSKAA